MHLSNLLTSRWVSLLERGTRVTEESSTSRTVFDAAWSLACQRSGLQFSDGPSTTLDKGRHLAVPLRFWEKVIGRNPRTLRSWLRVLGAAEPTKITFATNTGAGQWNAASGRVICYTPPGAENTGKPIWTPHEIRRLREVIAHIAIQREGPVSLMGSIEVRSALNYTPNPITARETPRQKRFCPRRRGRFEFAKNQMQDPYVRNTCALLVH